MRALIIIPSPYVSGMQIITTDLFKNSVKEIDSHFLLTHWSDGELRRRLDAINISYSTSWLGMFSRKLDRHNLRMSLHCAVKLPILYKDYLNLFYSFQPDVIYFAHYHELILLLPLILITRKPVIYHAHNLLPSKYFYQLTFMLWGRTVSHFIAVSQAVGNSISSLGVKSEKISVLWNGVDLEAFKSSNKRENDYCMRNSWPIDSIIIGMTGQMFEGKGHGDFLRAARLVNDAYPNTKFVIGGKQTEPYYTALQKQIIALDLMELVDFSGWESDMSHFYANIDILAFPSKQDSEGFGLVIAEAMAMGRPTVVTRSGGASEVIEDGRTGLLVDLNSQTNLAESLCDLVGSPEKRQLYGDAGRQRAVKEFDLVKQARKFVEILTKFVHMSDD